MPARQPERKTAAEILAINDVQTDTVTVPEWDTTVEVIGLTKKQQLDIRAAALVDGEVDAEKIQQGLFREGVTAPKFEEDQLPLVFQKSAAPVDRILKRILELSGMKEGDDKRAEATFP